jgi:hypothetical protein
MMGSWSKAWYDFSMLPATFCSPSSQDCHRIVPPIENLIGKYVWAESGVDGDGARGPRLDEGLELRVDESQGPFEFPNVNGEISIFEGSGFLTGIRRVQSRVKDGPEAWEFEIDWPEDGDAMFPCEARVYVAKVLDDNGFPFIEVQFGDDRFQPYAYGKRQPNTGNSVGFSDAEKERLNFLTNAMEKAARDKQQAEQKEKDEANRAEAVKEKLRKQQEKSQRKQELNSKKQQEQRAEKHKATQSQDTGSTQPKMSKGARKRANKARRLEEERARLELEQARFDLLKDPNIKLETSVKEEPTDRWPLLDTKPEEFGASLARAGELGIKRQRDEDSHTYNPAKRVKIEA